MDDQASPIRLPSAAQIEEQAKAAGLTIPALCAAVGVVPSTFYRWRDGSKISADLLERFMNAVRVLPIQSAPE